jgi:dissimilatory sulfite reductase (desulfoviridin) alpha/beta subunit
MKNAGIIPGRFKERVTLRVRALTPYSSELTSEQVGVIADIAERYGSGAVHVTPRQTIEIPDIDCLYLKEITDLLNKAGLSTGSTDRHMRNVTACSRWCLYNAFPLSDLAQRLNKLFENKVLPGKTDISLSGCDFSCVRSRTSDIGVIAKAEIEISDRECKKCSLCIREPLGCQVDAITITDEGVLIDAERCIGCGFCTNVCKPETIRVKSKGFDIYVGGSGGLRPREAVLYKTLRSEEEVLGEIELLLNIYSADAQEGERIGDLVERNGISALGGEDAK